MATWIISKHESYYKLVSDVNQMELAIVESDANSYRIKIFGEHVNTYGIITDLITARAVAEVAAKKALIKYAERLIKDLEHINHKRRSGS